MSTSARNSKRSSATEKAASALGRLARDERGVAAVEFAIVLPLLTLMLMAIIDWGFFFYYSESVVNAAREGARAGSVQFNETGTDADAIAAAEGYLSAANIPLGGAENQATATATEPDGNNNITCTVTIGDFQGLTGFLAAPLIPTGITYTSTMRWEAAAP